MFSPKLFGSVLSWCVLALGGCNSGKDGLETGDVGIDDDGDGYVAGEDPGEDCDDADAGVHPDAVEGCDGVDNDCDAVIDNGLDTTPWFLDGDGDGFGDEDASVDACGQPEGYVSVSGDCDDADTSYYPGADEDDCTDPNDYNCDGSVGYADADGDRYPACLECDDTNPDAYPSADERCNGVDDDCDGAADNDAVDADTWFIDYDTDGFGSDRYTLLACEQPAGFVPDSSDCDDQDDDAFPGADETCDGDDNDCDGEVDESSAVDTQTWFMDADDDGYGVPDSTQVACDAPPGFAATDDDCDDADATTNPGAEETCNDKDDNCDGVSDESEATDADLWYADADDDGYGLDAFTTVACEQPESYAASAGDCYDDGTAFGATINPDGQEICDEFDNDCDGSTDESDAEDAVFWYADGDGDGYGSEDGETSSCAQPDGYVSNTLDCDDSDDAVSPDGDEVCNDGQDSDCDGLPDGCWMVADDADTILYGEDSNHSAGNAIARGGDLNGDGVDDIVIAAYKYDSESASDAGKVYVAFGPISAGERNVATADLTLEGDGTSGNDDRAGTSVGAGGDLDGDGVADLLIGAIRYPLARPKNRGAVYALFGPLETDALSLVSDYDLRLVGENQFDRIGTGVIGDADLDGDGEVELALGTNGYDAGGDNAGGVYIVRGALAASGSDFNVGLADVTLYGEAANDAIGADLATVPDTDGDGLPELLIGNKEYDDDTLGAAVGCVYLVSAPSDGETVITDQATAVVGEASQDHAGTAVGSAGDMDGDGYGDLLVGAPGNDESSGDAGKAYLVFGPVTGGSLQYAAVQVDGSSASDGFGTSVAGSGDSDGDGTLDLLFGANAVDDVAENGGAAYLFLGPVSAGVWSADDAYATVYGSTTDSNLGSKLLFVGDTDGSGNDDILLAADNDDRGGSSAGAVFLFDTMGL